jgi:hypothetical protein
MKHALLSPSSADKWFECPAMPTLAAKVDYQVGLPAAVGTLIHSMTEQLLKGFLVDVTLEDYWLGKTELVEDFEIVVDQDMIDCAKIYVDYVQDRAKRLNGKLLIEQKVRVNDVSDKLYGYADAIIITPHTISVIDLKTGKYPVSPEHNKQAMIYAAGVADRYANEDTVIEITIVQPRATWGGGPIKTWETTAEFLSVWADTDLRASVDACLEENPVYVYGDHCRWCNARSICDLYKQYNKGEDNDGRS